MAQVVWTEPALSDLDAIADYIALQDPAAAALLVARIVGHVGQLEAHPESGARISELKRARYRQVIEPPCRVLYRHDGASVFILHVMRSERLLRRAHLRPRRKPK